jgi:hypothetical protein
VLNDDLAPFFVAGEFCDAEDTLGGAPVLGMYDASYVRTGGGMGMSDTSQVYLLPTALVPDDVIGMQLVHKGTSHSVVDVEPDGTGLSVLVLGVA